MALTCDKPTIPDASSRARSTSTPGVGGDGVGDGGDAVVGGPLDDAFDLGLAAQVGLEDQPVRLVVVRDEGEVGRHCVVDPLVVVLVGAASAALTRRTISSADSPSRSQIQLEL